MSKLVRFPANRRQEPSSPVWAELWPEIPCPPTPEQQRAIESLAKKLRGEMVVFGVMPAGSLSEVIRRFTQSMEIAWPPADLNSWGRVQEGLRTKLARFGALVREGVLEEVYGPAGAGGKGDPREPLRPCWQAIWPELVTLPTPKQERFIAELIAQVEECREALDKPPVNDPGAWLKGLIERASGEAWPPKDPRAWSKVIGTLREMVGGYQQGLRKSSRISAPQRKKIWALIRELFDGDRFVVDGLLVNHFPKAKRLNEKRKKVPSISGLTRHEAGQLIKMLETPTYVPQQKKTRQ